MKRSMVISLIGRPNVGKSSLFNRLMRKGHKAITHDMPGVTRDRHYGIAQFDENDEGQVAQAILVDTGGFYPQKVEALPGRSEAAFNSQFFNIMTEQALMAIEESDLVLFVVDAREGVLPFDEVIAENLRQYKKEFWLIVNKFDTEKQNGEEAEFYRLGIDEDQLFTTSAEHGLGLGNLRDALKTKVTNFDGLATHDQAQTSLQKGVSPREEVVARLALIGAPNAGKSTLLNQLIGAKRALVSDIPGTTVDPIEGFFDLYFGRDAESLNETIDMSLHDGLMLQQYEEFRRNNPDVFEAMQKAYQLEEEMSEEEEFEESDENFAAEEDGQIERLYDQAFNDEEVVEEDQAPSTQTSYWRSLHLVDTAGIRRQKAIESFVESQSVYRSLRCITESDIVLYMIDATQGIGHQDRRLIDIALEKGKSIILCLNKIDLLKEELATAKAKKEWLQNLRDEVPWLDFVDIVPISAKHGQGVTKLKKIIAKTVLIRRRPIPTAALNRFVMELIERHPIATKGAGGKRFKVKYTSMIKSSPPTFLFFTNKSKGIPENYRRYLKNGLRQAFILDNTPVHLIFRTGQDLSERMKKVKAP